MRILRHKGHLLRNCARLVLRTGVDYRGTNAAITYADYHTTRQIRVPRRYTIYLDTTST